MATGVRSGRSQLASLMRTLATRRVSGHLMFQPGICITAGQATTACRLHLDEALHWQTDRCAVQVLPHVLAGWEAKL